MFKLPQIWPMPIGAYSADSGVCVCVCVCVFNKPIIFKALPYYLKQKMIQAYLLLSTSQFYNQSFLQRSLT